MGNNQKKNTEAPGMTVLEIWGTRGSLPSPGAETIRFGGNTSCISLRRENRIVILDAGTGIIPLGERLMEEGFCGRVDLFLSHVHLDHILGLTAFPLLYQKGIQLKIYGEEREGKSLRSQLDLVLGPPYWPVKMEQGQAELEFLQIGGGEHLELGSGIAVDTFRAIHPDQCLMYKVSAGDRTVFYATDCEMNDGFIRELAEKIKECSLVISDAQYGPEELEKRRGWGHSSWIQGNALARCCGAGQVIHTHFDRAATDDELFDREEMARTEWDGAVFAREGMKIVW